MTADMVSRWQQSGWKYEFFDDAAADAFLEIHYQSWVARGYRALVPKAYKADYFRLCVLYVLGGLYADIDVDLYDTLPLNDIIQPHVSLLTPKQDGLCACGLWNGIIAAEPGQPVIGLAALLVALQVKHRFFAADIQASFCPEAPPFGWVRDTHLYLSGPDLLGRVLSSAVLGTACAPLPPGGTLTPLPLGVQFSGTIELLRQHGQDIFKAGVAEPILGTPKLTDMNTHHGRPYRWLWETGRAYTDTGLVARILLTPFETLLDFVTYPFT
eukprot:m.391576 g.391576  ORF g.391576 m.391576 type:complete len:270 (-) comp21074_c0_seq30:2130-2939(-)